LRNLSTASRKTWFSVPGEELRAPPVAIIRVLVESPGSSIRCRPERGNSPTHFGC
jgi:hypothetical protein